MGFGKACGAVGLIALLTSTTSAAASVLEVCASGCTYTGIQDAVDASADGDTVLVHPGTYNEELVIMGRSVELRSVAGPGATAIATTGGGPALRVVGPSTINIDGFSVEGAGPRVVDLSASSVTLDHMWFPLRTVSGGDGGVIYAFDTDLALSRSRFDGATASNNGGCVYVDSSPLVVTSSRFTSCLAQRNGGAIYSFASDVTVSDSVFSESAADAGNGGAIGGFGATLDITTTRFEMNAATGGGDLFWSGSIPDRVTFDRSFSMNAFAWTGGGSLHVNGAALDVVDSGFLSASSGGCCGGAAIEVENTSALIEGGYFTGSSGQSPVVATEQNAGPLEVVRSRFVDNGASAVQVYGPSMLFVSDSAVARGGGNGFAELVVNWGHMVLDGTVVCDSGIESLAVLGYLSEDTVIADSVFDQTSNDQQVATLNAQEPASSILMHDSLVLARGSLLSTTAIFADLASGNQLAFHNNIVYAQQMPGPLLEAWTSSGEANHNIWWSEAGSFTSIAGPNLAVGPNNATVDPELQYSAAMPCETRDYRVREGSSAQGAGDPSLDLDIGPAVPGTGLDDLDGDSFIGVYDCNDGDPGIHPGADEICNGVDDDCDGAIDGVDPSLTEVLQLFLDDDGDGYGDGGSWFIAPACPGPQVGGAFTSVGGDCNDSDFRLNPGATEIPYDNIDQDCSGADLLDVDGDGFEGGSGGADCDDANSQVSPGADETCNGVDDDCDTVVDNDPVSGPVFYADTDGDGFGDPNTTVVACAAPNGYVDNAVDCDDADGGVHVNADEVAYDGIDQDCDGSDLCDVDLDGFVHPSCTGGNQEADCDDTDAAVNPNAAEIPYDGIDNDCVGGDACDLDGDGFESPECGGADCNDAASGVNPGADELCNGVDDDCDGDTDPDDALDAATWYVDGDADGFGSASVSACGQPAGTAGVDGDCDDDAPAVNPDANEQCNDIDDDCNGLVDDDIVYVDWFADSDGDGFGDASSRVNDCVQPTDHVADATDCDDAIAAVNPDADELCNGIDDDCSGVADDGLDYSEWFTDADGDGFGDPDSRIEACAQPAGLVAVGGDCDDARAGTNPAGIEIIDDGVDNDCRGGPAASTLTGAALCGCSSGPGSAGWWVLAGVPLLLRRRRVE